MNVILTGEKQIGKSTALFRALPQNGFTLDRCPRCGADAAVWTVSDAEMRCPCHA